MAAQRKFISQTELEELLKNFIDNLSDDSVNEYSSDYDDSKYCVSFVCVFLKACSFLMK